MQHYYRGLALDPHQMSARYNLGVILVDLQRWQEGLEQLMQVVEERPGHAEAHNSLGVAHIHLQNLEQATWHFERAIALNPGFATARKNLQALRQQ